jgi:hypothetical protein
MKGSLLFVKINLTPIQRMFTDIDFQDAQITMRIEEIVADS